MKNQFKPKQGYIYFAKPEFEKKTYATNLKEHILKSMFSVIALYLLVYVTFVNEYYGIVELLMSIASGMAGVFIWCHAASTDTEHFKNSGIIVSLIVAVLSTVVFWVLAAIAVEIFVRLAVILLIGAGIAIAFSFVD